MADDYQTETVDAPEAGEPEAAPETSDATTADRLPDDHPVVKALNKANKEAAEYRLKVKEFEDAQKSDEQRRQEALDAAASERDAAVAEAARLRAAVTYGLTNDDLELIGDGTPEQIDERAKRLADRLKDTRAERRPDPTLGKTEPQASSMDQWLRDAVRN